MYNPTGDSGSHRTGTALREWVIGVTRTPVFNEVDARTRRLRDYLQPPDHRDRQLTDAKVGSTVEGDPQCDRHHLRRLFPDGRNLTKWKPPKNTVSEIVHFWEERWW